MLQVDMARANLSQLTVEEKRLRRLEQARDSRRRMRADSERWAAERAKTNAWRKANPDKVRKSRQVNKETCAETNRERGRRRLADPVYKAKRQRRVAERRSTDIQFRLTCILRSRLWAALQGEQKAALTLDTLGCSIPELIEHLEQQFEEGMSWENQGEWHVDHRIPLALYDLSDAEQLLTAGHHVNLRPMWAGDNLSKGTRLDPPSIF